MPNTSIQAIETRLRELFGLVPVMAAEIECYVTLNGDIEKFFKPVDDRLRDAGVALIRIEKERGAHQYEFVTQVTTPERLVTWLNTIKTVVGDQAKAMGVTASFAAKPYATEPSSGLHLHLHLGDAEQGINAYHKTDEWISDALRWSLGGLLSRIPHDINIFCPAPESYTRFADADHVPRSISWGVNNRYCALRIPANEDPYDKRIEHRVPGADADPALCVLAMLKGVAIGLEQRIEPPSQEFGKPASGLLESFGELTIPPPLTCTAFGE